MAFTPGYVYDIFISYAHVDNIAFPGQADGWIKQFYDNLNLMLAKRAGRLGVINFWWDTKKLDGSVLFNPSIEDGIKKSAIMICLNSPGYIASDYCKQELDTFYNIAKADSLGLNVGNRSRILNVLLNNIPFDQWPAELNGTSGFPLHDAKDQDDFGDTVETISPEFKTQLQNIRDAVWSLLNEIQKAETAGLHPSEEATTPNTDAFTIYMGEVADTLRTPRKRVITELEKKGFKVLTGVPPPDEAEAHTKATEAAIHQADLSIHLLDQIEGREIVDEPGIWYPQKQVELALASGKAQMIWMPAETDIAQAEEDKYRQFLQGIESGKATQKTYEFVRGSKSTLAQDIIDFADTVKAKQQQKTVDIANISVLLDTHFKDQLYALDLGRALLENQVQPFINPQEDDPRKNINLMGDRLAQVKKLIFLYGSVSKDWVLERMSAALQLIITNNYPIEDFFVYMAPPHKESGDIGLNQRFLKINVFNSSDNSTISPANLQQFIQSIKTGAA